MGYRLNIEQNEQTILYGSKLYGYCNENKLKSYHYLIGIGKFTGNEFFDYGHDNRITLNSNQMKKFIKYYARDLKKFYWYDDVSCVIKELNEAFKNGKTKKLFIIDWE